jgi:hypothetical protein
MVVRLPHQEQVVGKNLNQAAWYGMASCFLKLCKLRELKAFAAFPNWEISNCPEWPDMHPYYAVTQCAR